MKGSKGYTSNAGIFAKRGDPWVSRKQGESEFGRNLDSENPDYDQFAFAKMAKPKTEFKDPPPIKARSASADYATRKANIILRAKQEASQPNPEDDDPFNRFRSKGVSDG